MLKDFMYYIVSLIAILASSTMLCTKQSSTISTQVGRRAILRVIPPITMATLPDLRCFHKGCSYKLDELCCVITNGVDNGLLTIIITPYIHLIYRSNRPNHWELYDDAPMRWFECTPAISGEWVIKERLKDEVPLRIPESAIILLTPPSLIADIIPPTSNTLPSSTLAELPVICFEKNLTRDRYLTEMTATACSLPDIETFHCPA